MNSAEINDNSKATNSNILLKVWSFIGMILTAFSLISLFGDLRIITLSEFIGRVIQSYRNLVHPIVDFVNIFSIEITQIEKDMLFVIFFAFERLTYLYVSDQLGFKPSNDIYPKLNTKYGVLKKIDEWSFKYHKWQKSPTVVFIFRILFRTVFFFLIFAGVTADVFTDLETSDSLLGLLLLGVIFLPIISLLITVVLNIVAGFLTSYVLFPPVIIILKLTKKNRWHNRLVKHRHNLTIKNRFKKFKIENMRLIELLYFNLSILLLVLLLLGANYYFNYS